MDSLIFDTSALLNFGHRGELTSLLKKLSCEYKILTTPGAQAELTDPDRKQFYATFLGEHFTVQSASTVLFDFVTLARLSRTIDPGEISVMTLTKELNGVAVLDEKAARREAKMLGLKFTGTLGLLSQGLQKSWLNESDCLASVTQLWEAGFAIPRPASHQSFADYLSTVE